MSYNFNEEMLATDDFLIERDKMSETLNVEIFGKMLSFDKYQFQDIKLVVFMNKLEQKVLGEVRKVFEKAGGFNNLYDWRTSIGEQFREIYKSMYKETFTYVKSLKGSENIRISDIQLESGFEELQEEFDRLEFYFRDQKIKVEIKMREDGLSEEQRIKKRVEYERGPYKELQKLFENAMLEDVDNLIDQVETVLTENGIGVDPTYRKKEKARTVFECLQETTDSKIRYEYAYELINLDPTVYEYFDYCLSAFPEQLDKLLEVYIKVGFAISDKQLSTLIDKVFKQFPHETEDQTLVIKSILDGVQSVKDIQKDKTYIKVNKLLTDFDLQARTFQGIEFSTREKRKKAEEDYNILSKKYEDILTLDEVQCNIEKEWIVSQTFDCNIAQIFLAQMDERIQEIWKKEDSDKFSVLFQNMDIYNEASKNQAIKIIGLVGKSSDKNRYIEAIQGMTAENISMFQKYEDWKKKSIFQKYGIGWGIVGLGSFALMNSQIGFLGIIVGCIMFFIQQKETKKLQAIWNLLTVDGTIIHKQLLEKVKDDGKNLTSEK